MIAKTHKNVSKQWWNGLVWLDGFKLVQLNIGPSSNRNDDSSNIWLVSELSLSSNDDDDATCSNVVLASADESSALIIVIIDDDDVTV